MKYKLVMQNGENMMVLHGTFVQHLRTLKARQARWATEKIIYRPNKTIAYYYDWTGKSFSKSLRSAVTLIKGV